MITRQEKPSTQYSQNLPRERGEARQRDGETGKRGDGELNIKLDSPVSILPSASGCMTRTGQAGRKRVEVENIHVTIAVQIGVGATGAVGNPLAGEACLHV